MFSRLVRSLRRTVAVTAAPEVFRFASPPREASIETTLRLAPDGRILGFGDEGGASDDHVVHLFDPGGAGIDEQALVALCRRGLALVLGPWPTLRPRVVLRVAEQLPVSRETFRRVLEAAGASTVELATFGGPAG